MPKDNQPVNLCDACGLVHPPLIPCQDAQSKNIRELLARIGQPDTCRGCTAPIFWVRHKNGANAPYNEAGLNHFIDCPNRDQFKRGA